MRARLDELALRSVLKRHGGIAHVASAAMQGPPEPPPPPPGAPLPAWADGAAPGAQDCFSFQDNGMMAYIGHETAVMGYGGGAYGCDALSGRAVGLAWHVAYWGMLESARMMCLVPFDWAKCAIFGRDSSRA